MSLDKEYVDSVYKVKDLRKGVELVNAIAAELIEAGYEVDFVGKNIGGRCGSISNVLVEKVIKI